MSKQLAVLGSPISHSKSPAIHTAAYRVLNQNFEYSKIQVEKNHLMQFVETLDANWLGLSVTAPLKNEAFRLSRNSDDVSQLTGASNTLLRSNGGWDAFNTDVFGIQKALAEAGVSNARTVSVIGSGATAQSAVLAIARSFPETTLNLAARNKEAVAELMKFAHAVGLKRVRRVTLQQSLSSTDLVLTTLPARALDNEIDKLQAAWFRKPKGVLFDVAYDPWPSEAAKAWQSNRLTVISGVEMLLWQAIAQIRIFVTGNPNVELPNEAAVMLAMRDSIGLI
jgi:shikimate dehydrogenase